MLGDPYFMLLRSFMTKQNEVRWCDMLGYVNLDSISDGPKSAHGRVGGGGGSAGGSVLVVT